MTATTASRADLHCHSTASQVSKLGVQRALGLPECATPPEEVYALARRRGMDFVTITDHDTIAGGLEIGHLPGTFLSEELTARFRGEPQAVHVLCLGITPDDHDALQGLADDVEDVAGYLDEHGIAAALAHPFYAVAAPLDARHRRRLARLFGAWEVRNGARAPELNHPAATYVDTHGGTGTGGSDDHAGVDVGRTWTEAPACATPVEFLAHVRAGRVAAAGAQGSAAKWAHAAIALAIRSLGRGEGADPCDPLKVLQMVERITREGDARGGGAGAELRPDDARAVLAAWLEALELEGGPEALLARMQEDDFSHAALHRRARDRHERRLRQAVATVLSRAEAPDPDWPGALLEIFQACIAAVPYAPAGAFLSRERRKLAPRDGGPARVALVADGIGATHGVARTVEEIRRRGVPGFEVEVIGTDPGVDRRLAAVAEVEVPFSPGLEVGVPTLTGVVEALADGRYDVLHLCAPGPAGVAAALAGRLLGLPVAASYHTELTAYARLRSGDPLLAAGVEAAMAAFYGHPGTVLSPSAAADARLGELGVPPRRIARWDRGVDVDRFSPARRLPGHLGAPGEIVVLTAGRLTREKGIDLLADAFLEARARDRRLRLAVAGGGPEQERLRRRLRGDVRMLGWLEGGALARAYASADLFLFCSETDTFGQVVLEAQASGLPVVAVRAGGPAELIADGRSGILCEPDAASIGATVAGLAASRAGRRRLAAGGLLAARERSWEAALERLASGWRTTLAGDAAATPPARVA